MASDCTEKRELPTYESLFLHTENIQVNIEITENCCGMSSEIKDRMHSRREEYQECFCENHQKASQQILESSQDSRIPTLEGCEKECFCPTLEGCEKECFWEDVRNGMSDNQIDEIDITSIPREHNLWQLPKDHQYLTDNSLPNDAAPISTLTNELHTDMDLDSDLGSSGKTFAQAPPRYGSLIEFILNDAPPNYSEATGVVIDVDEIWVKKVEACNGRNRQSDNVRQLECNRTCKIMTLALMVLIGVVAVSFIAVTFI